MAIGYPLTNANRLHSRPDDRNPLILCQQALLQQAAAVPEEPQPNGTSFAERSGCQGSKRWMKHGKIMGKLSHGLFNQLYGLKVRIVPATRGSSPAIMGTDGD